MLRNEVEVWMKERGLKTLGIVLNETDNLGVYCELKAGVLYDYTGHRVDRKVNIWGYITHEKGKPIRHAFI